MTPDEIRLGWIREVFEAHPYEVARYRSGESKLENFLLGETLRVSGGRANPRKALDQIRELARAMDAVK